MTSSGVSAIHNSFYINGVNVDEDFNAFDYEQGYSPRGTIHNGIGAHQFNVGIRMPKLKLTGYRKSYADSQQSAWEQMRVQNATAATDVEYDVALELGNNAAPAVGDRAIFYPGKLAAAVGAGDVKPDDIYAWSPSFSGVGKAPMTCDIVSMYIGPGDQTSAAFDSNPNAYTLPIKGAVCGVEIIQPTGTKASGTISATGTISDGDLFTLGGVTYTFKTSLSPTAGQILIGSSYLVAMQNLYAALTGGYGAGTLYATGTAVLAAYLAGTVNLTPPGTTGIITITYRASGTAGNAYTLAFTGTNLAKSGTTLASGVAGETAAMTFTSATSSGGSYTTFGTFLSDGTVQKGEWLEIVPGTTINRYLKVGVDMSSTSQIMIAHFYFARYWSN